MVTATNSHGEMVLGDAHDRERLRLNLHCLGQHAVERMLAPPAGYGHLNSLIRVDRTASFVHRLFPPAGAVTLDLRQTPFMGRPPLWASHARPALSDPPCGGPAGPNVNAAVLWRDGRRSRILATANSLPS